MTTKIKTNMLYIASDNSSDQQPSREQPQVATKHKITEVNKYALTGSHKMNNNLIAKGYFHQNATQKDYELQKIQNQKSLPQKMEPRKKSEKKLVQLKSDLANVVQIQQKLIEQQKQVQIPKTLPPASEQKTKKQKRSKTLMFQFDNQQDNQISQKYTPQQQTQNIKKEIDVQIESIENKKSDQKKTQPQVQKDPPKKPIQITPTDIDKKIDKKQFFLSFIPIGHVLQCKIIKKNQFSNFLFSQYDMVFRNFCSVHVASCKKFAANLRSNYRISIDQNDFTYINRNFVGKVRSIAEHKDLFNVYDDGISAQKSQVCDPAKVKLREVLCTVRIRSGKGPRQVEVYLLKKGVSYYTLFGISLTKQSNLQTLYTIQQNRQKIHYFKSRKPQWVSSRGQYFLNFGGRVNQASIRNFILEDPTTKKQVMLFGKNQNNLYNLDISYPLTPLLGFGIVVPQLDRDD